MWAQMIDTFSTTFYMERGDKRCRDEIVRDFVTFRDLTFSDSIF
jgi:hypothetical protein